MSSFSGTYLMYFEVFCF